MDKVTISGTRLMTVVEQLAAYAAGLRYEDLPAEVVRQATRLRGNDVGAGCADAL